ncbi:MAG: Hsp33 family molecular chaperone HslO [Zoogloea sp.]|uniref:Hsp33 family molecular chaperone HslO n=1 Tax=Zoogloea sp. TaxID=49181 RepID=UPI0026359B2D|nr:Hsp33 family molecular chaperone HslO [Zoogloea sp.]MDD2988659.1 Hsp33 family molecular chaperone HslO [Zoogloea sp.]
MSTSTIQRFLLEDLDIRGAIVRLDEVWQALLVNRDYAPPVRDMLGAMSAVASIIGGNLKQSGRLTIQLQGHGPVSLLVVDVTEGLNLRGYAKASDEAAGKTGIADLVGDGHLLLTLDMPGLSHPYQSYVPIEGSSVAEVFEHYLTQSEQQPAALHTAASSRSAACLFLQKLPDADRKDPDGWDRITRLAATIRDDELLGLSAEDILIRLFHQETVRLLDTREVTHEWPQNWEKVREMLRSLGRTELDAMLAEHGEILIHDDLSNHEYRFDADDVAALFAEPPAEPRTLH